MWPVVTCVLIVQGIGKPVYMDLVTNMCQLRIDRRLLVQAKDLCNAGLDKAVDLVADLARKVAELETKVHADLSACLDRRQAYSIPWLLHRANSLLVAANATYLARVHHLALLPSELRPPLQHLAGQAAGGDLSRIQEAMKNELQAQDFMRQAVTGIYIVVRMGYMACGVRARVRVAHRTRAPASPPACRWRSRTREWEWWRRVE